MLVSDLIEPPVAPSNAGILDRFAFTEGLSGSAFGDFLRGDDAVAADIAVAGARGSVLTNIGLINGLQELLGAGVDLVRLRQHHPRRRRQRHHRRPRRRRPDRRRPLAERAHQRARRDRTGTERRRSAASTTSPSSCPTCWRDHQSRPARDRARDPAGGRRLRHRTYSPARRGQLPRSSLNDRRLAHRHTTRHVGTDGTDTPEEHRADAIRRSVDHFWRASTTIRWAR